jgi:hypothetical protein
MPVRFDTMFWPRGAWNLLDTIHGNHAAIKLTPGLARQLHHDSFKVTNRQAEN